MIANSATVKVGDVLTMTALVSGGGVSRASAGNRVLGVCVGIVSANGIDLDNASPNDFDGTWTSSSRIYAASSNNKTNKLVKAKVVVDKYSIWFNDTAGDLVAADEFKYFDLTDQDQIADQDGHNTAGAFLLIKRDPDGDGDASKGLFVTTESYMNAYTQA
ncbi:MAG: hypothetical protein WC810_14335 [Janthinobacterium sp.]